MTHAPLGEAFLAAVSHVFRGKIDHLEAIDVVADQDLGDVQQLAAAVRVRPGAAKRQVEIIPPRPRANEQERVVRIFDRNRAADQDQADLLVEAQSAERGDHGADVLDGQGGAHRHLTRAKCRAISATQRWYRQSSPRPPDPPATPPCRRRASDSVLLRTAAARPEMAGERGDGRTGCQREIQRVRLAVAPGPGRACTEADRGRSRDRGRAAGGLVHWYVDEEDACFRCGSTGAVARAS